MTTRKPSWQELVWPVGSFLAILAVLGILVMLLGEMNTRHLASLPLLLKLIGASILLIGVFGGVRVLWSSDAVDETAMAGHISLILAGGIVAGGGWGCGLGLGLLGSVWLFVAHPRQVGSTEESAE